jgi:hypothetical protein
MPSSYADYVKDWESLLEAVRENQTLLPNVDVNLIELSDLVDQVKQQKTQQELHAGARQKATQDLGLLVDLGKEAAVKLRGFVKAKLGPRNELLVRFGVAPVRTRVRRTLKPPPPPPPVEVVQ